MFKKNLKSSLFLMDFLVLVTIFACVYLLFEFVINKILVDYSVDKFYDSMRSAQVDLNNSLAFLDEKKELDYKKSAMEIFDYLKISVLKRAQYDNSVFEAVFPDSENYAVIGIRKQPDLSGAGNFTLYDTLKKMIDKNTAQATNDSSAKKYIEFGFNGLNYIGIAAYSETGIRKSFERTNDDLMYPIIVIADDKNDFFFRLNRVRDIFFALFSLVFGIGAIFKIYSTINITREIYDIRDRMTRAGKDIREKGLISGDQKALKKKFIETTNLDDSFSELKGALADLGDIISGIADRELFIATLKKDDSLLKPHNEMMTIMYLDIQDFTGITERHKDNIMGIVNHIWTEVEHIISKNKGKINKLIGDAALLIFLDNHRDGRTNSALNAFYSAIELLSRVPLISRDLDISFNFRIGLDYGNVTYGKTGSDKNYELGVIGDNVNTASRLESICKQYHTNLLMTEDVYRNLRLQSGGDINIRKELNSQGDFYIRIFAVDKVRPKGKKEPKELYTVIKRKGNDYALLGIETYYDAGNYTTYRQLLSDFLSSIQEWRNYYMKKKDENEFQLSERSVELKNKAEMRWSVLVRNLAEFYLSSKLPLEEHLIKMILKFEEFDEFQKVPKEWLKKSSYLVKEPS
ncbi:MAG: adenylate/guanylate cyclase domain-containing protein, partial [Brevinematales bacterium]